MNTALRISDPPGFSDTAPTEILNAPFICRR